MKKTSKHPKVLLVIDDGVVNMVLTSDTNTQVEITELDPEYANYEMRLRTYDAVEKEPTLHECDYTLHVPGRKPETEVAD